MPRGICPLGDRNDAYSNDHGARVLYQPCYLLAMRDCRCHADGWRCDGGSVRPDGEGQCQKSYRGDGYGQVGDVDVVGFHC